MAKPIVPDAGYAAYATTRQAEILAACIKHGSISAAARHNGWDQGMCSKAMKRLRKQAALQGFAPEYSLSRAIPEPYIGRGHSTMDRIDPVTGERTPIIQWTKSRLDDQAYLDMMKEAISSFIEDMPKLKLPKGPRKTQTDIIPWINIGDAHLGMLAHASEVGENFDIKIAETELMTAIAMLIEELPFSDRLVINDLGDFTHYENFTGVTEASGHALDFDTRFPKMIRAYSRIMRMIVDLALTKATNVDIIVNQGNHSRTNDIWMSELLRVAYGSSKRVSVLNNDNVFIPYRMGNTLVMTHHSDKCKPARLADVMMTDFRQDYGETEHHYIDIGHVHHNMVLKEYPGVFIESFNHLAALDKYAHDAGYRNRKSITVVLRSKQYGEVGRRVLPIQEIRDRMAGNAKLPQERRDVFTV